jgi:outer membrane receptor protein involved in Fe transport
MLKSGKENKFNKITLAICAALTYSQPSLAFEAKNAEEDVEKITVTGSRIKKATYESPNPTTVLSKDALTSRSHTNLADGLNELPAFSPTGSSPSGSQSRFSVGQNFVDFLGMGSQRTLTLVNGRRFVSSNAPTNLSGANPGSQVDLNLIPTALIERVETISIGGAPIYGSDAIAGTVNIILKNDFEGFEFDAQYGEATEGDAEKYRLQGIAGFAFDDNRGNFTISAEYNDEKGLMMADRDFTNDYYTFFDNPENTGVNDGIPDLIYGQGRVISVVSPTGIPSVANFFPLDAFGFPNTIRDADGNQLHFGANGRLTPINFGDPSGHPFFNYNGEGLRLQDYQQIRSPIERTLVNGLFSYDVNNNTTLSGEFNYADTSADSLGTTAFYQSSIFMGTDQDALTISSDNAYLHPEDLATLRANGLGMFGEQFYLHKVLGTYSNGSVAGTDNELMRGVIALDGYFTYADRDFDWNVSVNYGKTESESRGIELLNKEFYQAADAVIDPVTGEAVCRVNLDPATSDPNCVPMNVFGDQVTQEAMSYFITQSFSNAEVTQKVFSASIAGDLFESTAGSAAFALGYEHREEDSEFIPDSLLTSDLTRSPAMEKVIGGFETDEFFIEFEIPLIDSHMGILGFDKATFNGAIRYVDHSLAGGDTTWTAGLKGIFNLPLFEQDLSYRTNFTRSIRAPSIVESFLPTQQVFRSAGDPCDSRNIDKGGNPDVRRANCIADAAQSGYGDYNPDNFDSFITNSNQLGETSGNSNLENEVADSWTFGLVYSPSILETVNLSVDYVNISIEDSIQQLVIEDILEACYDTPDLASDLCNNFTRNDNFQITSFMDGYENAGTFELEGLQFEFDYLLAGGDFLPGDLKINASAYHVIKHEFSITGFDQNNLKGEIGTSDWRGLINLHYQQNSWSYSWQARYVGSAVNDNNDFADTRDQNPDSVWYHNATVSYEANEQLNLRLTINNIFDKKAYDGVDSFTAVSAYDVIGSTWQFGVKYRF